MKRLFSAIIILILVWSCQNSSPEKIVQTPISYSEVGQKINFENSGIKMSIDENMKIQTSYFDGVKIQSMVSDQTKPNDYIVVNGLPIYQFPIDDKELTDVSNNFGIGKRLQLSGKTKVSAEGSDIEVKKVLTIELYDDFPNAAVTYVNYINLSDTTLEIDKTVSTSYKVDRKLLDDSKKSYDFSLFQGRGVDWGLDYANIKVDSAYAANNFIGMVVAKRDPPGGGIPVLDLWSKEMGMAIAHISEKPEFVSLPIKTLVDGKIQYAIEEAHSQQYDKISLEKGEQFNTVKYAVMVHSLDYFDAMRTYAEFLNAQGVKTFKETPEGAPNAYWKTWGYELDFKVSDIYEKVPEFKELGIEMVVLDDGWFSNYGDWEPSTTEYKFPQGRKSLSKFVSDMHEEDLQVGIWWCPLIAEPESEVAKENPSWYMRQENGEPYVMEKPSSYYLCPDYAPVLKFWEEQIEKLYITFDLDFIYHDWANLIQVPPCYNPEHGHESPLSPHWNLSKQYKVMYDKAQSIKPGYAIEMCECGRPHDPYKLPFYNITNASDANSKEQVRRRLKLEKALNGSKVYFNPGYVQPVFDEKWGYDPCEMDECVAMGGYFETYYTELTPDKKKEWMKWMKIYKEEEIFKGEYLNLYDIANDVPEFHVTKKSNILYYYAPGPFRGEVELRGLDDAVYSILDFNTNKVIATVKGPLAKVNIDVKENVILRASITAK